MDVIDQKWPFIGARGTFNGLPDSLRQRSQEGQGQATGFENSHCFLEGVSRIAAIAREVCFD